ncbi:hypothetical protein ABLB84_18415 [Xenorhabdus szentirmaii]
MGRTAVVLALRKLAGWLATISPTQQPPTKVGGLVINGLKVRIRIG